MYDKIIIMSGGIDTIETNEETSFLTVGGYASTFKPLRNGVIIPKDELEKALPVYMQRYGIILLNHDNTKPPVGKVVDATIDNNGLYIIAEITDPQVAQEIKDGLWTGFSVGGFGNVVQVEQEDTDGDGQVLKHVVNFDLMEISVVSTPADAGAVFDFKASADMPLEAIRMAVKMENVKSEETKDENMENTITENVDNNATDNKQEISEVVNDDSNMEQSKVEVQEYVPPVVNEPYDLSEDWSWDWAKDGNAIIEALGWEGLAKACAIVEKNPDGSLPESKDKYHLPHHKLKDGKLVLVYGGVISALRRLPQTNVSDVMKEEGRKHLEKHRDFLKSKIEAVAVEQPEDTEVYHEDNKEVTMNVEVKDNMIRENIIQNENVEPIQMEADALRVALAMQVGKHIDEEKRQILANYYEGDPSKGGVLVLPEYEKGIFYDAIKINKLLSLFPSKQYEAPEIRSMYLTDPSGNESVMFYLNKVDTSNNTTLQIDGQVPNVATFNFVEKTTTMDIYAGIFGISEVLLEDLPSFYDFMPTLKDIIATGLSNTMDKLLADTLSSLTSSDVMHYETISGALPDADQIAYWIDYMEGMGSKNLVLVMHPETKHYYRTLKTTDGYYRFINPIVETEFTMFGLPVIGDIHVPQDKVFLVDVDRTFEIAHYKGLQFKAIPQDLNSATNMLVYYRFITRFGLKKKFGKIVVWEKTA